METLTRKVSLTQNIKILYLKHEKNIDELYKIKNKSNLAAESK